MSKVYKNKSNFGHYLAGLWEGDGNVSIKNKTYPKPTLQITFHKSQLPLAEKLLSVLESYCNAKVGSIFKHKSRQAIYLNISSIEGLKLFVTLTHHKLRGPKVADLNNVKDYLNIKHKTNFSKAHQAKSALTNNAWLAGFIDADGSFALRQTLPTKAQKQLTECAFILVQRRSHPKSGLSYDEVFRKFALTFNVKIHLVKRSLGKEQLQLKLSSALSKAKLRHYLETYPLLTSKRLDFQLWCRVDDLMKVKQHYTASGVPEIQTIKQGFNTKRTWFNWAHLESMF